MEKIYDLIVVGLGPCGIRAAQIGIKYGLSVLAFEKKEIGGTCLNLGCIPTKTILKSAGLFEEIKNCNKKGVKIVGEIIPDIGEIKKRKDKIVQTLSNASKKALELKGVKIIQEEASVNFETLEVNGHKGKNIIIATGSSPFELPNLPFDGVNILSSDDILNLEILPKKIAIIGSGAIGVEWARILSAFNCKVTVVEKASNLLPLLDISIQKRIERQFKMKKIDFYTGVCAKEFKDGILTLDNGKQIEAEKILVAIGRKKLIPKELIINPDLSTNYSNVYAAGDVANGKMLAHKAQNDALYIINKITGKNYTPPKDDEIPSVIYGSPEIASIGINEQNSDENYKIYELPLSYLPKSWCDDKTDGFIKLITKDGLIKGAHIVSPEASSLIGQIQFMMKTDFKIKEIENIPFAHPSYSEGILEAILNG